MPVQPWVGFRPREWVKSSQYVGYTAHWNVLDFAGLSMPVDVGDFNKLNLDAAPGDGRAAWKDHEPRSLSDRYNWTQCKSAPSFIVEGRVKLTLICFPDDPDLVSGMPVGIQIVGGKFGEEKTVAVAKAVEEALQLVEHS